MDPSVSEPVAKRADQLVVGDRIPEKHLPYRFHKGPADVVLVADEPEDSHTFIAYRYSNGRHESHAVTSDAELEVFPAPTSPIAQHYDASDVGGADCACGDTFENVDALRAHVAQPLAERPLVGEGGVWTVPVAGGLIEVDPPEGFVPASAPQDCHHECTTLGVSPDCGVHEHELRL